MIGPDIEKPFGDDEDANRAARSVMSIVGQLSIESRKLAQTDFRKVSAMNAQRGLVLAAGGRGIGGRARSEPDQRALSIRGAGSPSRSGELESAGCANRGSQLDLRGVFTAINPS